MMANHIFKHSKASMFQLDTIFDKFLIITIPNKIKFFTLSSFSYSTLWTISCIYKFRIRLRVRFGSICLTLLHIFLYSRISISRSLWDFFYKFKCPRRQIMVGESNQNVFLIQKDASSLQNSRYPSSRYRESIVVCLCCILEFICCDGRILWQTWPLFLGM